VGCHQREIHSRRHRICEVLKKGAAMSEQAIPAQTEVSQTAPKEEIKAPEATQEAQKDAKKEEIKEEDVKAKRFADLSKREQKILRRKLEMEKELKEKEESLSKRESDIKRQAIEELKQLARTNPDKALEALETNYNSITDWKLNAGKVTPETVEKKVLSEVDLLKKQIEDLKNQREEEKKTLEQKKNEEVLQNFQKSIVTTLETKAEEYPAAHAMGGAEIVYHMIQQRYHDTKGQHLLKIDEACALLEKDLTNAIEKVVTSKGWQKRLASNPKKEDTKQQSLNKQKPTITNDMTSTAPSLLPPKAEADRLQRALARLSGEQLS
jgi:hypothetical protein